MLENRNSIVVGVFVGFVMWTGAFGPQAIAAPYYEGKTLVVIEGRRPGGTGSLRTQATMKYVQKHLSGNPSIVYKYMPGGGGTAAANHMANRAKRDGLTIANIGTGLYSNAMFGARGVRYKLEDFVSWVQVPQVAHTCWLFGRDWAWIRWRSFGRIGDYALVKGRLDIPCIPWTGSWPLSLNSTSQSGF